MFGTLCASDDVRMVERPSGPGGASPVRATQGLARVVRQSGRIQGRDMRFACVCTATDQFRWCWAETD